VDTVELAAVNRLLIHKQHLARKSRDDDVVRVAGDTGGLHGTGIIEPHLALFSRSVHLDKADLDRELTVTRRLVKLRCMRGTLYIVPREMVPIVYGATRAMIEKLSRRYGEFMGFVGPEYEALTKRVLRLLQGRQLAVVEIQEALKTKVNLGPVLNLVCDLGQVARIQAGRTWPARGYKYG
jgi:hypothetical protein